MIHIFKNTRKIGFAVIFSLASLPLLAQNADNSTDSISIRVIPGYDSVSKAHRKIFGENYRKEYASETKLPVIRISQISAGLTAIQRGGGNQSHSLRLKDKNGREWVLRSVEKYPEVLLPIPFQQTFAKDIIKDNMSAQHPFSALAVTDLAEAAGVPHSSPVIGYVVADKNLGEFSSDFVNTVCLIEEREPLGNSNNSAKMYEHLKQDNTITVDAAAYLRAKCLDVLVGDWDRHDDQWRWKLLKSKTGGVYMPVPRDRDQVFFSSDGWIQRYAQSSYLLPMMQGYERNIQNINWFLWEGRELNSRIFSGMEEDEWSRIVKDFCGRMTDEILEKALSRLPAPDRALRQEAILAQLKLRRETLPAMMQKYYHFFNRIVDVEVSDKNERIAISDYGDKGLNIKINKISDADKNGLVLLNRNFDPNTTKEIRVYMHGGDDSLILNNNASAIKLRIIGGVGNKSFDIQRANGRTILYNKPEHSTYAGTELNKLSMRISSDSSNTAYVAKDLYRRNFTFLNAGFNNDDGLLLGLTYNLTSPGFRKKGFGNSQSFSFLYSFGSSAFNFNYKGEWFEALGSADLLLQASVKAPSNTQNFFGLGNETRFDEHVDAVTYYRARFDLYQFDPAVRWKGEKSVFSVGPSVQYYRFEEEDNEGRFILNSAQLHSSDSTTVRDKKLFAGVVANFTNNTRDNNVLPKKGTFLDVKIQGYKGINNNSESFGQLNASFSFYQKLDKKGNLVIADRIGGGVTVGKPTFYQSQFLGGQGNLLGFRQYRFAGKHSVYNNLEMRLKLGDFVNYILPGEVGLMGLYDVGRVWKKDENSDALHHGVGGGIYFAPASLTIFRFVVGHSNEGWYPYAALSFRY